MGRTRPTGPAVTAGLSRAADGRVALISRLAPIEHTPRGRGADAARNRRQPASYPRYGAIHQLSPRIPPDVHATGGPSPPCPPRLCPRRLGAGHAPRGLGGEGSQVWRRTDELSGCPAQATAGWRTGGRTSAARYTGLPSPSIETAGEFSGQVRLARPPGPSSNLECEFASSIGIGGGVGGGGLSLGESPASAVTGCQRHAQTFAPPRVGEGRAPGPNRVRRGAVTPVMAGRPSPCRAWCAAPADSRSRLRFRPSSRHPHAGWRSLCPCRSSPGQAYPYRDRKRPSA